MSEQRWCMANRADPACRRLASKFGRLGSQAERIQRAQSAINNPNFYRQIGIDPDAAIEEGKRAMRERFGPMGNRGKAAK